MRLSVDPQRPAAGDPGKSKKDLLRSSSTPLTVLACKIDPAPDRLPRQPEDIKPAPQPGIEWIYENSDCMAQEGAFRQHRWAEVGAPRRAAHAL